MKNKRLLTGILCGLILANLTSCSIIDSVTEILSYMKTDNDQQSIDTDETDQPYTETDTIGGNDSTETDDTDETEPSVTEHVSADPEPEPDISEPEPVIDDNTGEIIQNTSETAVDVSDLDSVMSAVRGNGQFCAMVPLNYFDSTWEYLPDHLETLGYTDMYPFLTELTESRFACGEGTELYLVIPGEPASSVKVEQIDNSGNVEKVLYQSDSGSFFVMRGNGFFYTDDDPIYGNAVCNLQFTITKPSGESFTCLSGRDFDFGNISPDIPVLDLTSAAMMKMQSVEKSAIIGSWNGYVIPDDGRDSFAVSFEFSENGTMSYTLGNYTDSYTMEHFYGGTWERIELKQLGKPGSVYVFDLTLTESIEGAKHEMPEKIYSRQYITTYEYIDEAVVIQAVDCDSLYPNAYEYQVFLYPSEGFGN